MYHWNLFSSCYRLIPAPLLTDNRRLPSAGDDSALGQITRCGCTAQPLPRLWHRDRTLALGVRCEDHYIPVFVSVYTRANFRCGKVFVSKDLLSRDVT